MLYISINNRIVINSVLVTKSIVSLLYSSITPHNRWYHLLKKSILSLQTQTNFFISDTTVTNTFKKGLLILVRDLYLGPLIRLRSHQKSSYAYK